MPDTRAPFDHAVRITAAVRNVDTDTARAALIVESLDWLIAHLRVAGDREAFVAAVRALPVRLSDSARHYSDRADTTVMHAEGDDDPAWDEVEASREVASTLIAVTAELLDRHR